MSFDMNLDLFDDLNEKKSQEILAPNAVILHGFATSVAKILLGDLQQIIQMSPFRHMTTPNGFVMSVAMTNCGELGWVSDSSGYRYDAIDPITKQPWPGMPRSFLKLAISAAEQAGFKNFNPDVCLINRYEPKTKLSLHQDKDEKDFDEPIVSISLGIPAMFLFGGLQRTDKPQKIQLLHGDVVVWGGLSRLYYHGIMPIKEANHPLLGRCRVNLTFRRAVS